MNKLLIVILSAVLIMGCGGGKEQEESFQGVSEQKDYVALGMSLLKKGDVVNAIHSFDEAIKQDPTNPKNFIILSEVYIRLKNVDSAVDTMMAASRIAPNDGDVFYFLAYSLGLQNREDRKEMAIQAAKRSVELFQQNREADKFQRALVLLRGLTERDNAQTVATTESK